MPGAGCPGLTRPGYMLAPLRGSLPTWKRADGVGREKVVRRAELWGLGRGEAARAARLKWGWGCFVR